LKVAEFAQQIEVVRVYNLVKAAMIVIMEGFVCGILAALNLLRCAFLPRSGA
jgi:hypothetical protein